MSTASTRMTREYSIHTDDALGVALTVTATCSSESACLIVDELGFD